MALEIISIIFNLLLLKLNNNKKLILFLFLMIIISINFIPKVSLFDVQTKRNLILFLLSVLPMVSIIGLGGVSNSLFIYSNKRILTPFWFKFINYIRRLDLLLAIIATIFMWYLLFIVKII